MFTIVQASAPRRGQARSHARKIEFRQAFQRWTGRLVRPRNKPLDIFWKT